MRNSSFLLFKTLIFISILNLAHSMSCSEFDIKLHELKDNFGQIFIMNYQNAQLIYARKEKEFYVFFNGEDLFLKFDQCVEKDNSSYIILSNILDNKKKYEFDLNAKLVKESEYSEIVVNELPNKSDPRYAAIYDRIISIHEAFGVSDKKILEYIVYLVVHYNLNFLNLKHQFIKKYILQEKNEIRGKDELILYRHGDVHTDKDTQLSIQSKTTSLVGKADERVVPRVKRTLTKPWRFSSSDEEDDIGFKQEGTQLNNNSSSDEEEVRVKRTKFDRDYLSEFDKEHVMGSVTDTRDLSDPKITSLDVSTTQKDPEHGVVSSSNHNKILQIKTIKETDYHNILAMTKSLTNGQSIILSLEDDKLYRDFMYNKIIIEKFKRIKDSKYYNIYLFTLQGDEVEFNFQPVYFIRDKEEISLQIGKILKPRENDQFDDSNNIKPIIINNYSLYTSTTITEEKLKKIQEHEAQVIQELNEKYKQNFVSLKKNILTSHRDYLRRLLKELPNDVPIVLVLNKYSTKSGNLKKIEFFKVGKNRYNVRTTLAIEGTKDFYDKNISIGGNRGSLVFDIYSYKKIKTEKLSDYEKDQVSYSIINFDLYCPVTFQSFK